MRGCSSSNALFRGAGVNSTCMPLTAAFFHKAICGCICASSLADLLFMGVFRLLGLRPFG